MKKGKFEDIVYDIPETLEELLSLKQQIRFVTEDSEHYYIMIDSPSSCNNAIWVANKNSGEISEIYYTDYIISIEDKVSPVDPETLRKIAS